MSLKRKNLMILACVIILAVLPLIFLNDAAFEGADVIAEGTITDINSNYEPWFETFWEPPSGEVESLLFALQAALGSGFIGYYIGLKRGKSKVGKE